LHHPRLVLRLFRSFVAGAAATLTDLAVLAFLVSVMHIDPRHANVPALIAGGIVNFVGNRHFAFRAGDGHLGKQIFGYSVVEIVALVMNGILFELAMLALPGHQSWYAAVRLVTSHVVFLAWSYPLWRLVFKPACMTSSPRTS
jgi:putative flippase GtrA